MSISRFNPLFIISISLSSLILLCGVPFSSSNQNVINPGYIPSLVDENQFTPVEECAVPCNRIESGGPPPDGIPSIDKPIFLNADDSGVPSDNTRIIGIEIDGVARAYPYDILNWHEIVNDEINGQHFSVTYCPLTKSGILYHTEVLGNSELGTSGSLYENNLVFYDRTSKSWWSQMLGLSLTGEKIRDQLNYGNAVETTWNAWKQLHPDTVVLSRDTGFSRDYNRNPYLGFQSDDSLWFSTTYNANTEPYNLYHMKALTVILRQNGNTKLLPFEKLEQFPILNHQFEGLNLITLFDQSSQMSVTYSSILEDGTKLSFFSPTNTSFDSSLTMDLPIFQDLGGTVWNFKGEAISGYRVGQVLEVIPAYNAFWFAATTFFYNALIFVDAGAQHTETTFSPIPTNLETTEPPYTRDPTTPDPIPAEQEVVIITEVVVESFSVEVSELTVDSTYTPLIFVFSAFLLSSIIRTRRMKIKEN